MFILGRPQKVYREGEGEGGDAGAAAAASAAAAAAAAVLDPDDLPDDLRGRDKFTPEEMNKAFAHIRRKSEIQTKKTIAELEGLRKSKTLTDQEKITLSKRIDELSASMLTKEQLAAQEKQKLQSDHQTVVKQLSEDRDTWKTRYHTSSIRVEMLKQASAAGAIDEDDIIARLKDNTENAEEIDSEGKGTGRFIPKVKFDDTDEQGKPVTLNLTIEQAVKRMKEMPKYGHLFKSTANAGLGGGQGEGGGNKVTDITKMDPAQYRKYRVKMGLAKDKAK